MFYYQQLNTKSEKQLYQTLKKAVESHTKLITICCNISGARISQIFMYLLLDYPDFFWTKGDFSLTESITTEGPIDQVSIHYLYSKKECIDMGVQIQEALMKICDCIEDDASQETIVRTVAAWFQNNVIYSAIPGADQTIYSALVMQKSVCMGISRAMKLVLRLFDIDSIVVIGSLFKEGIHAWNMVCLDNIWYHLDVAAGYECFDRVWAAHGNRDRKPLILVRDKDIEETHSLR